MATYTLYTAVRARVWSCCGLALSTVLATEGSLRTCSCKPAGQKRCMTSAQATPNGMKAHVALEEVGASYTVKALDLGKNEQKEAWYTSRINPNGEIAPLATLCFHAWSKQAHVPAHCRAHTCHDRPLGRRPACVREWQHLAGASCPTSPSSALSCSSS